MSKPKVLETMNKILTNVQSKVVFKSEKELLANTNGATTLGYCYIKTKLIVLNKDSDWQTKKDVNFHEVSHLRWTPDLRFRCNHEVHNFLEDCRIDTLRCAEFPKQEPYSVRTLGKHMIKADMHPSLYFLLYGRKYVHKYLDITHQRTMAENYYGKTKCRQIEKEFDKYIVAQSIDEHIAIVNKVEELLSFNNDKPPKSTSPQCKDFDGEEGEFPSDDLIDIIDIEIGSKSDNGKDVAKKKSDKSDDKMPKAKSYDEMIRNADIKIEQLELDNDEVEEVDETEFVPTADDRLNALKLERFVRRLKLDLQPNYVNGKKKGKVDLKRVIQEKTKVVPTSKVFKKFQAKDAVPNYAVSIIFDSSVSIGHSTHQLELKAVWTIAEASLSIGNPVQIIEFASAQSHKVQKDFNNKDWTLKRTMQGNTAPFSALEYAYDKLLKQRAKKKVVILITDGDFNGEVYETRGLIHKMNKKGIETNLIKVGYNCNDNDYNFKKIINTNDMKDLVNEMSAKFKEMETTMILNEVN